MPEDRICIFGQRPEPLRLHLSKQAGQPTQMMPHYGFVLKGRLDNNPHVHGSTPLIEHLAYTNTPNSCSLPSGMRIAYGKRQVTYIHLLMENHEILLSNGAPAACRLLGPNTPAVMTPDIQQEVKKLLPELLHKQRATNPKTKRNARQFTRRGKLRPILGVR